MTNYPIEEKKIVYLPINILWKSFTPDKRQWKPSTPVLEVDLFVEIKVPLTAEYIANSDKILTAQITASNEPVAIFTPAGMRYVIDQIENVMSDKQEAKETKTLDESEWEEETPTADKPTTVDEEEVTWTDEKTDNLLDENEIEWE